MGARTIPEQFLRHVWHHQCFSRSNIHTSDGRAVEILFPGIPNNDAGPDFRDARIRIGAVTYYGDVEVHHNAADWRAHRHDCDPCYNRVILHVVMTTNDATPTAETASHRSIPLFELHPFLDSTLYATWGQSILNAESSKVRPIRCSGRNWNIPADIILQWIERLAIERIELKVRRFEERMKQLSDEQKSTVFEPHPRYYGNPEEIPVPKKEYTKKDFSQKALWEQLLYEGVMGALGFSKNRTSFLALARAVRLERLRQYALDDTHTVMALLFGVAGLLPSTRTLEEKESRTYVRALRRRWRELRPAFKGTLLHEADWLFFRLRPQNFPTARLATMCFMLPSLFGEETFRRLIGFLSEDSFSTQKRIGRITTLLECTPDEFWQHHYHFQGRAGGSGVALGTSRTNEIIANVIIPIVLLYARVFTISVVRENARLVLAGLSGGETHSITDRIQKELLRDKAVLRSALLQQGAIQLFTFFCSPGRCPECEIGHNLPGGPEEAVDKPFDFNLQTT